VVAESVVAESVVAESVAAGPVVAESEAAESVVAEPVDAAPIVAEPVLARPVLDPPVVAQPLVAEPIVAVPVSGPIGPASTVDRVSRAGLTRRTPGQHLPDLVPSLREAPKTKRRDPDAERAELDDFLDGIERAGPPQPNTGEPA
jgi:hypothetical protein